MLEALRAGLAAMGESLQAHNEQLERLLPATYRLAPATNNLMMRWIRRRGAEVMAEAEHRAFMGVASGRMLCGSGVEDEAEARRAYLAARICDQHTVVGTRSGRSFVQRVRVATADGDACTCYGCEGERVDVVAEVYPPIADEYCAGGIPGIVEGGDREPGVPEGAVCECGSRITNGFVAVSYAGRTYHAACLRRHLGGREQ